ncbi:MAG: histidine--tRNA ligase [Chitinophagales bacterium]|nr:histidine--tRNA ligase [Chitinophagales bacterium]MCZ2394003.1 histidine--tRNA ligase [Chitinophagales bacterium]
MSQIKPRVFKGARDFLPEQMLHRERITDVMRKVFKKYGFSPIETPAIEYLDVLAGKYGEDADRLIYRLDYKSGTKDQAALHYDLTVPFSRLVAMNPDLTLPFKRYQIQPVWRADRPQPHQGRFREFYQCDIDAVGSKSMLIDAEMVAIAYEVLKTLGFTTFIIKINNRKILNGITQYAGLEASMTQEVCRSIDKLDKMSWDDVEKELIEKEFPDSSIQKLGNLLNKNLTLDNLSEALPDNALAQEGIAEIRELFGFLKELGVDSQYYSFDLSLARGLDYYTGPIFETKLSDQPHMGSLTGGGRYDQLIGMFTGKEMPAVGTTLGLDRIFTAMQQLNMLEPIKTSTKVLVAVFSKEEMKNSLQLASQLRAFDIATEIFPEPDKLKKQFTYADKKGIPFMAILGQTEIEENKLTIKDLRTGKQKLMNIEEAVKVILGNLTLED